MATPAKLVARKAAVFNATHAIGAIGRAGAASPIALARVHFTKVRPPMLPLIMGVLLLTGVSCRPALAQPQPRDPDAMTDMMTGESPQQRDQRAWKEWLKTRIDPEKGNADAMIEAIEQFSREHPRLHPSVAVAVAAKSAVVWNKGKAQPEKALAIYELTFNAYRTEPIAVDLLARHARLLLELKRPQEAEELLQERAASIWGGWSYLSFEALRVWVKALQAQGKNDEAIVLMQNTLLAFPELWPAKGVWPNSWFQEPLSRALLQSERAPEALSWAKLRWMLCATDAESIDLASRMLVRSWNANGADENVAQEFSSAQNDASIVNPLRAVALPPLPLQGEALEQKLAKSPSGERVSLLLWAGRDREAMLEAQKQWQKQASPASALEVARVFKAVDLNLARARAFLAFARSKTGENPIDAFLLETAPDGAATPEA